jgi:hypothetical protein
MDLKLLVPRLERIETHNHKVELQFQIRLLILSRLPKILHLELRLAKSSHRVDLLSQMLSLMDLKLLVPRLERIETHNHKVELQFQIRLLILSRLPKILHLELRLAKSSHRVDLLSQML